MKLTLKEDPREWRKAAWMSALGLAIFTSLLRWRRVLPATAWGLALCFLAALAVAAGVRPKWFRRYYRFSARMGFFVSRMAGYAVLALLFFVVVTPLGLILRLLGKDPLRLRRPTGAESYWTKVRQESSLERLF